MTTKTKRIRTKGIVPPLTRRERRIVNEAKSYGLTSFGTRNDLKGRLTARQSIKGMTDEQRNYYFDLIEDFCSLVATLRAEN